MTSRTVRDKARTLRVALYAARQALGLSLAEAGALIGRSDHSAVCRAENVGSDPAASLALVLAYAEQGQIGPVEVLCREAGGQFVHSRAPLPPVVRGATWAQLHAAMVGAAARVLNAYAHASGDGHLSRSEHVELGVAWRELREVAAAGEALHGRAAVDATGHDVNAPAVSASEVWAQMRRNGGNGRNGGGDSC